MTTGIVTSRSTPGLFEGIDLACTRTKVGRCYLVDNGNTLQLKKAKPVGDILMTAIDCPFGTTVGFVNLLDGELPQRDNDWFRSRDTEKRLRDRVDYDFETTKHWKEKEGNQPQYLNRWAHIQPTLRMETVPNCLWKLGEMLCLKGSNSKRLKRLVKARKGIGCVVEAHPRIFLYSLVERLWQSGAWKKRNSIVKLEVLRRTRRYNSSVEYRRFMYQQIRTRTCWMGEIKRAIEPSETPDWLVTNAHNFDAFLCALTAFSHYNKLCLEWRDAGIDEEIVKTEGHILVLNTQQQK